MDVVRLADRDRSCGRAPFIEHERHSSTVFGTVIDSYRRVAKQGNGLAIPCFSHRIMLPCVPSDPRHTANFELPSEGRADVAPVFITHQLFIA